MKNTCFFAEKLLKIQQLSKSDRIYYETGYDINCQIKALNFIRQYCVFMQWS